MLCCISGGGGEGKGEGDLQLFQELDGGVHGFGGCPAAFVASFLDATGLVGVIAEIVVVEFCRDWGCQGGGVTVVSEEGPTDPFVPFHASETHCDKVLAAGCEIGGYRGGLGALTARI